MASEKRFEVCDRCGHEVVEGVACDSQPSNCPFHESTAQMQQQAGKVEQAGDGPDRDDTHFVRGYD